MADPRTTKFFVQKFHWEKIFLTKFEEWFIIFKYNLWSNIIISPHLTLFTAIFIPFIAQNAEQILSDIAGFESHIRHLSIN